MDKNAPAQKRQVPVQKKKAKGKSSAGRFFRLVGAVFASIFEEVAGLIRKIPRAAVFVALGLCVVIAGAVVAVNHIPAPAPKEASANARGSDILLGAEDHIIGEEEMAALEKEEAEDGEALSEVSYTVTFDFFNKEDITCVSNGITVGQLMESAGIVLSETDYLRAELDDVIMADSVIAVDEVIYKSEFTEEYTPYETEYKDVQTIPKGTTETYRSGVRGVVKSEYNVTYVNGVETERTFVNKTETAPTNAIVYRGIGGTITINGKVYNYSYKMEVESTYYTGGGITATGLPATEEVIAVDPRVIPYGTKVYIPYVGNIRIAADTGGMVKGKTIDVYLDEDNPLCQGYGRRHFTVYILEDEG